MHFSVQIYRDICDFSFHLSLLFKIIKGIIDVIYDDFIRFSSSES